MPLSEIACTIYGKSFHEYKPWLSGAVRALPISPVPAVSLQAVWCLPAEGKRRKSAGFGQTERKQQAVCQLECDADIQNPNLREMTLKAWNSKQMENALHLAT